MVHFDEDETKCILLSSWWRGEILTEEDFNLTTKPKVYLINEEDILP